MQSKRNEMLERLLPTLQSYHRFNADCQQNRLPVRSDTRGQQKLYVDP